MSKSIADLYRRNKREAAARQRAALREATVTRLAQLPASETPLDQRIQEMLQANRPNCQDVEAPTVHMQAPAQVEAPAARLDPIDQAAADFVAQAGSDYDGRVGRAVELAKAGEVEFPRYGTTFNPAGKSGFYQCGCPDALHRNMRGLIGQICKHSIAAHLYRIVTQEAEAVATRKLTDRRERRR